MELSNKEIIITARGIIIHDEKMLVVSIVNNNFYCLAGGKLEPQKEDILECLDRELIEELGVKPEIGRLLYISTFFDKDNIKNMDFIFEIKNSKDYLDLGSVHRTHSFELNEICWKGRDEDIKFLPKKIFDDFKEGKILFDEVRFIKQY